MNDITEPIYVNLKDSRLLLSGSLVETSPVGSTDTDTTTDTDPSTDTNVEEFTLAPSGHLVEHFRIAAWTGDVRTMKRLARTFRDYGIFDQETGPILQLAVANCQYEAVEWLLAAGLNPNTQDSHGVTALHRALWANNDALTLLLLNHGANPGIRFPNGDTALSVAAFKNNFNIVRMLLGLGYDAPRQVINTMDVAMPKKMRGTIDLAAVEEQVFRRPSADSKEWLRRKGITPLHIAACQGHSDVIEKLVLWGYSLDEQTDKGQTPMLEAFEAGHYGCLETLLRLGARVNGDEVEPSLLIRTATQGNGCIMSLLVRWDTDVNRTDLYGKTALHHACDHDNAECIRMLLEYNAGRQVHSHATMMPAVHCLAFSSSKPEANIIRILRIFVQTNTDIDYKYTSDKVEKTPIRLALERDNLKVACWLALVGCGTEGLSLQNVPQPYQQYLALKKAQAPSLKASCRTRIRQQWGHNLQKYLALKKFSFVDEYLTFMDILYEEMELPFSI